MSENRPERKRESDKGKQEIRGVKQVESHQQREANHKGSQEKEEELLQCADLSLYLGVRLLYFAILPLHLVFFNFDIGKSSFAVMIYHFHSVRFIMVFCQGNMQFGMALRNEFWTR